MYTAESLSFTRNLGNIPSNTNEHPFEWQKIDKMLVGMWINRHFIIRMKVKIWLTLAQHFPFSNSKVRTIHLKDVSERVFTTALFIIWKKMENQMFISWKKSNISIQWKTVWLVKIIMGLHLAWCDKICCKANSKKQLSDQCNENYEVNIKELKT